MFEFKLPSLGSDMDSGTLLEWRVAPGEEVRKGDVLAVVDTSKAAVDVETWVDGRVLRLVTEVGQTVPVGSVMALLLAPGEVPPEHLPTQPVAAAVPVAGAAPAGQPAPSRAPVASAHGGSRARVTPVARRRAAALGLPLDALQGSGPDGTITLDDVERAGRSAMPPAPPPPAVPPTAADRAAAMRQAIAAAMARSKREIPHYYLAQQVPMRAALDWLQAFNAERPVTQRLLPAVLLIKAVALALREVPEINGLFVDGAFRPAPTAHVGVAISLRQGGLVAPALHDVAAQPLDRLMAALADLVRRARAGSLRSSEMADPTITVTNLGETGADEVFGVIYPPQVALVGFGRIAERPWVEDGRLVVMPTLQASLAADHRASDGHRGAVFLARLGSLLQQPDRLAEAADPKG
ncbi:MAG: 2-oxo acid dehydrogenase subunit E2 [Burkholderiaceae bacterium]|nr:2-oxo acid dehydrogenase subunit E2 [Burkholderiaceae bacterium]